MKQLHWLRRPHFARAILEVGGGHNPYHPITHAVDKFPSNNAERAGNLELPADVEFKEGDLEAIPFFPETKFDFIYVSHIFEHVFHPDQAIAEINRVAIRGYLATPTPLREQLVCPHPFDPNLDYHRNFCWKTEQSNSIHVIQKTPQRLGEFCSCKNGQKARYLYYLRRQKQLDIEPLMPGSCKETSLHFKTPLKLTLHSNFQSACSSGACAYKSIQSLHRWIRPPGVWTAQRFQKLRKIVHTHRTSFSGIEGILDEISDTTFESRVLKSTGTVVVVFWANWSGASKALSPTLAQLEAQYHGKVSFLSINTDQNPITPRNLSIHTIPSILVFKNGSVVRNFAGNQTKQELSQVIDEH